LMTTEPPLREHPRPDFERPAWVNLNGQWAFDFDPNDAGEKEEWFRSGKHRFGRQITVPFPWESRLSGIGDTEYRGVGWYSRRVKLPSGGPWTGRDPWLIVGACDWEAKVWVNGEFAGEHVGGYVPFEINLGRHARLGQTVDIVIRAVDFTKDEQPTGKQIGWYTRNSGIWQTVYLEPRAKAFISAVRSAPKVADGSIRYDLTIEHPEQVDELTIFSPDGEFERVGVRLDNVPAGGGPFVVSAEVVVDRPEPWSPDSPRLYGVTFELAKRGRAVDTVKSYFGLREVSISKADGRDYQYIRLNGKPLYLRGALHQSFHPEGIYQYPSDAVVRSDYELCKAIGINFLRIHIKAPVPRELYWADRLGVLIMQDLPNYWVHSPQACRWWQEMMEAVVARDRNHPCTFAWCDFNETWGIGHGGYKSDHQVWVEDMWKLTKRLDPTRLVEDNSPCNYDHVVTDINSWHFYINDYNHAREHIREVVDKTHPGSTFNYIGGRKQGNEPLINSEYGGIGAGQGDQDVSWCFKFLTNELRLHDKVCGYVYTELSDIEWEHNGFVNYDRTLKEFGYAFWFPGFTLADLNSADFVVIDAPPMIVLNPFEPREVPIKISHWSHRDAPRLALRFRTDWIDGLGSRREGRWQSRPATWAPFQVVDQPAIRVEADVKGGIVGALLVEVLDGNAPVARNYVNLLAEWAPRPPAEALDVKTLALRFNPMDFAEWAFDGQTGHRRLSMDKVSGTGAGRVEYRLQLPEGLPLERLAAVTVLAELASNAGDAKL
ncbi:MAG: hypothetical protein HY718_18320, partial [Planctomycetes bacterium]|nr:hypothetical protein [Planctomycetota bacterium]